MNKLVADDAEPTDIYSSFYGWTPVINGKLLISREHKDITLTWDLPYRMKIPKYTIRIDANGSEE